MKTVYNRPVTVERVFGEVVRVRYHDNGLPGYVPVSEVSDGD
jgi:hypothetical protein